MARTPPKLKKTVSPANLAQLGEARLAELLMEAGDWDPVFKRQLRLELAAAISGAELAFELDKRLTSLAESRARVSWRKRPDLMREVEALRRFIVGPLLLEDQRLALDRMVAWFDLFAPLERRTKDPRGELRAMFDAAVPDLATVAAAAGPDVAAPVLRDAVLTRAVPWVSFLGRAAPDLEPALAERLLRDLPPEAVRSAKLGLLVRRLAARTGDVDAWLATFDPDELRKPATAAEAALKLASARRPVEARALLTAARSAPAPQKLWRKAVEPELVPDIWFEADIAVLVAEGRGDDAVDARWVLFERTLRPGVLRDIVSGLADFEDVVAVDRAVAYARGYFDLMPALRFLMEWGALRDAAEAVVERQSELKGRFDDLPLWASRLSGRWPVAALLLIRARVEALRALGAGADTDINSLLAEAEGLAASLSDEPGIESHSAFVRRIGIRT